MSTMYVYLVAFLLAAVIAVDGATINVANVTSCHSSFECGHGMCCRSSSGHVITNQQLGGFGPHIGGGHQTGTCVSGMAASREMCDSMCECGAGLACYRPMSGVCCPPMLCYDEDYVKKQREYWANCSKDPTCFPPP